MTHRERILQLAREAGFELGGFAPLAPPPDAARFRSWLAAGRHGSMDWLERQSERICDPRLVRPEARTMLVLGCGHSRPAGELAGGARVARYALGRDYHRVLTKKLRSLARTLLAEGICSVPPRVIVDAGPLLERSHAARAGIGFASKAANLLHPRLGPWFFLAELLLDVPFAEIEHVPPSPPAGSCGTCTACLDACPTGAIVAPGIVHAPDCISYQTIEQRGAVPHHLRARLGPWLFGCDVCSEVCPWGRDAPDLSARWGTHELLRETPERPAVVRFLGTPELSASPLARAKREGMARNAALVLGNLLVADRDGELTGARHALLQALEHDPSPLVRAAAAWALERAGARPAVERALRSEPDESCAADMRRTLADDSSAS